MNSAPLPEVQLTEVDGVPTVRVDAPGPLRAGLLLRVGVADETLATRGTAHLMEHLALFGTGRPGDHGNGAVDRTVTMFCAEGDPRDVARTLASVSAHLHRPPLHRLPAERDILRAESAGRGASVDGQLAAWRYGAADYGLIPLPEYGVDAAGEPELAAWAARYAVRENAALWLTGPPPAGLRLGLPSGGWQAPPDPTRTILPQLPAWFCGPGGVVALHALVERSAASAVLGMLLRARLLDELRTRRAVAYAPCADREPLTGTVAQLLVAADPVPGRQAEAGKALVGLLRAVAAGAVGADEPAELVTRDRHDLRWGAEPQALAALAHRFAEDVLHRADLVQPAQWRFQLAAVTAHDVVLAAQALLRSALLVLPEGSIPPPDWACAPAVLHHDLGPLPGRTFTRVDAPLENARINAGVEGIMLRVPVDPGDQRGGQEESLAIPVGRAAGVLCWPDGRRTVIGKDCVHIDVEPTLWADGGTLVQLIDEAFPAPLRIPRQARSPEQVPMPRAAATVPGWWYRTWPWLVAWLVTVVVAVAAELAVSTRHYWLAAASLLVLAVLRWLSRTIRNRRHLVAVARKARAARAGAAAPGCSGPDVPGRAVLNCGRAFPARESGSGPSGDLPWGGTIRVIDSPEVSDLHGI